MVTYMINVIQSHDGKLEIKTKMKVNDPNLRGRPPRSKKMKCLKKRGEYTLNKASKKLILLK